MEQFDLCVIGAGPSGYAAAIRGLDYGKKVLLIEKDRVGGAGVFNGALSSKTLWELSEAYKTTKSVDLGFQVYDSELNYKAVISEMNKAIYQKHQQLKGQIDLFCRYGNLTYVHGTGVLKDKNTIQISTNKGNSFEYIAKNIVIAIGSRPRKIPSIPIDERIIVTSDGINNFEKFPKSIVILGAGVIGCEFATIFSNFGKTEVHLIDKQDRILPFEDEDVSSMVSKNFQENGVLIHRESEFQNMKIVDDRVEYTIKTKDGKIESYNVEKALISIGRVPNVEGIGLQEIGMKLDNRGYAIDEDTQTSISNIYAVGDFTADIALVNIAEMEGRYAVERIFDKPDFEMTYDNISTIMFVNPEIAGVGMNEQYARKNGIAYRCAKMNYRYVSRAIAMRKTNGLFKILVTDDDEMKILGMRVAGNHASSTIEAVALMIKHKMSIQELANLIHPHPSITEGIQTCARMLLGKSIIKPFVYNQHIKCYRYTENGQIINLDFENDMSEKVNAPLN